MTTPGFLLLPRLTAALLAAALGLAASPAWARSADKAAAPAETSGTALEAELHALIDQLKDRERRTAARDAIVSHGVAATPALLERRRDPDFTVRWEFANIQGLLKDERALDGLVDNILRDEDPHIRWRSLWALDRYNRSLEAKAQEALRGVLGTDEEPARYNAAVALAFFHQKDGLPLFHERLSKGSDWERWEAINALARVHGETSVSHLRAAAGAFHERHRAELALTLGKIGSEEAIDFLIELLGDADRGVRLRAALGLGRAEHPKGFAPLAERLESETDEGVREQITKALARLAAADRRKK